MDVISRSVALAFVLAAGSGAAGAQQQDPVTHEETYVSQSGKSVRCMSTASGRTYCGTASVHYTVSGKPPGTCVEGKTWGTDEHGAWVSGGCNAEFVPTPAPTTRSEVTERTTYVTGTGRVVHCVSAANGRSYCGRPHERFAIRGTPDPACVEGSTWGVDERGVWVSGGCVADFQTSPADDAADSGAALRRTDEHAVARVIHCMSAADGRTYCGAEHQRYILHGTPDPACVEGRTWGVDEHGAWVSNGCQADFEVEEE